MILQATKPQPLVGDYKFTRHFAWSPTKVDEGVIWLERYKKVYQYIERDRFIYIGSMPFKFENCANWDLIATQREGGMGVN